MDEQNVFNPEEEQTPEVMEETPAPAKKKKSRVLNNIIYFSLMAIFVGVFVYCGIYIAGYVVETHESNSQFGDLSDLVNQYRDPTGGNIDATLPTAIRNPESGELVDVSGILPEYREIYAQNTDMVGWINVPGTTIDYPVMQTPSEPNFYLYKGFDKKKNKNGCLYIREACDVFTPGDNVVIYGHHMRNGSMFTPLDNYKKKAYWKENQYFTFDTIYEKHTYQIIAVFKTSANLGKGFSYHTFNFANSEEEFNAFMAQVHKLQFYDTGLTAEYGDMLLTLSTCEYTLDNGRFVVVAKRVS